ncbi:MAG: hypothetical protein PHW03_06940 [Eubacteriales bacterium]|nr:hypothetical protein [Eubacteriales bacterium]
MNKKRVIAVFVIVLLLLLGATGCNSKGDISAEFAKLVSEEPTKENVAAAKDYFEKNIGSVDDHDADYMVQLIEDFTYRYDSEVMDYSDFAQTYKMYMSDTLYEYYLLKAEEQNTPVIKGGTLQKDFGEIMERALKLEAFIRQEKETLKSSQYKLAKEDSVWMYEYYINFMLKGSTVNPVFSYETGEFTQTAKDNYAALANKNPGTVTAWAVEEFFTYLKSVDYNLNYENPVETKVYYDTCTYINSEAGKKVYE